MNSKPADEHLTMFDDILSLVLQHYVIIGIVAMAFGLILNLAVSVLPEIVQNLRINKLS